mmetsp:Transcript_8679/g.35402  ORF Transcript_8679/g.35402 Transcript_8679/m.35402 type:complete len:264 (-) Transcript_8679:2027-2818(-)
MTCLPSAPAAIKCVLHAALALLLPSSLGAGWGGWGARASTHALRRRYGVTLLCRQCQRRNTSAWRPRRPGAPRWTATCRARRSRPRRGQTPPPSPRPPRPASSPRQPSAQRQSPRATSSSSCRTRPSWACRRRPRPWRPPVRAAPRAERRVGAPPPSVWQSQPRPPCAWPRASPSRAVSSPSASPPPGAPPQLGAPPRPRRRGEPLPRRAWRPPRPPAAWQCARASRALPCSPSSRASCHLQPHPRRHPQPPWPWPPSPSASS